MSIYLPTCVNKLQDVVGDKTKAAVVTTSQEGSCMSHPTEPQQSTGGPQLWPLQDGEDV